MGLFSRLFRRASTPVEVKPVDEPPAPSYPKESVVFDEQGVTRTMLDGRTETVTWDELQEVEIITTDTGPYLNDIYWMLSGDQRGCAVPDDAHGMRELLNRLQSLPGFDNQAVIDAMQCTSHASFLCWKKPQAQE